MNPVTRGVRNAFRNGVRTGSIVAILGLSIGLALTMLIAQKAVDNKIQSIKSNIGNTISISPAGYNPGSTTNNALSSDDLEAVAELDHVSSVTETLSDRLSTTGTSTQSFGSGGSTASSSTTSLTSPVELGDGPRFMMGGSSSSDSSDTETTFSMPVTLLGTTTPDSIDDASITIASGETIDGSEDTNNVLISQAMADKNDLKVGSTFTAYDTELTVVGIFTTSTESARGTVVMSLSALQRLSGQDDIVTSATVTVDSLDNLSTVTDNVSDVLGDSADVTSAEEQAESTVEPLNSVKTVSTFSLIGAVVAGSVIILLLMVMVVRERKKEIGVVKAIGGSNLRIISEFMVESVTLALMGAVVGLLIGIIGGQPVTSALVDNSSSSSSSTSMQMSGGPGGMGGSMPTDTSESDSSDSSRGGFGGGFRQGLENNQAVQGFSDVKAQIGLGVLLQGFGAAILIAVLGSALAAGMISRVRPSTVMRSE